MIGKITSEMAQLQEQKNEALRMKLRGEVDLPTYRAAARSWTRLMISWTVSTRV